MRTAQITILPIMRLRVITVFLVPFVSPNIGMGLDVIVTVVVYRIAFSLAGMLLWLKLGACVVASNMPKLGTRGFLGAIS